ncbi:hypothetical protein [Sphingobacterium thalpophilum]|uniref:Transglutaminase-like domain-containing protein n=1 Tax=Sphingobacterium thalpophilum TaxID=259 RepID=A0A4U9VET3_9SPHI|nr:hypothetical protein [Sphingobacterium thalpophilum]VTR44477.1 Uncharacterised protein [Sphingobacterium thalpophilum]
MTINRIHIAFLTLLVWLSYSPQLLKAQQYEFDFYDGKVSVTVPVNFNIPFDDSLTIAHVQQFYQTVEQTDYYNLVNSLLDYKDKQHLNDWVYYQLIRRTAQQIAPKAENYARYTLYKWFLMCKSGYDARLAVGNSQIIFFIQNNEDISDIPFFEIDGKKYTCLNFHDYGKLFQRTDTYVPVKIKVPEATNDFSYKITKLPDFVPANYIEKQIAFNDGHKAYHFNIKLNNDISDLFKNYPGVDFETYFNIPLSKETYQSLIPALKENLKGKSEKDGVDYLMRFTRYAFLYENDEENFGKEKRLSPEQTLLNTYSDCDDRAALFFYLVKEIYNLPMITLLYPTHITMAVQFEQSVGDAILYNGKYYSVCEPTPQAQSLAIGQLSDELKTQTYQIVYHYEPR